MNKLKMPLLIAFSLTALMAPVRADVPVPPEVQRHYMQESLDKELAGLSAPQQRTKVEKMLADIPRQRADMDKQIAAGNTPDRKGTPVYMLRKQRRWLDDHEAFLKEWLSKSKPQSAAPSPPEASSLPVNPAPMIGYFFLAGGLLLAGRRLLRPAPQHA